MWIDLAIEAEPLPTGSVDPLEVDNGSRAFDLSLILLLQQESCCRFAHQISFRYFFAIHSWQRSGVLRFFKFLKESFENISRFSNFPQGPWHWWRSHSKHTVAYVSVCRFKWNCVKCFCILHLGHVICSHAVHRRALTFLLWRSLVGNKWCSLSCLQIMHEGRSRNT